MNIWFVANVLIFILITVGDGNTSIDDVGVYCGHFLAKCQWGVAPFHIETGRGVGGNLEERVCFNCHMEESEHVIIHRNIYNDLCDELFLFTCNTGEDFR